MAYASSLKESSANKPKIESLPQLIPKSIRIRDGQKEQSY